MRALLVLPPLPAPQSEYDAALSEMQAEAKRAAKLEQKVGVLLTGLQQRDGKLRKQVDEAWDALLKARTELLCFQVRARAHATPLCAPTLAPPENRAREPSRVQRSSVVTRGVGVSCGACARGAGAARARAAGGARAH